MSDNELEAAEKAALEITNTLRARGRRRAFAECPAIRAEGPLHHIAEEVGVTHKFRLKNPLKRDECLISVDCYPEDPIVQFI